MMMTMMMMMDDARCMMMMMDDDGDDDFNDADGRVYGVEHAGDCDALVLSMMLAC